MFVTSLFDITSEVQLSHELIYQGRMLEYVQSVIVSSESDFINNKDNIEIVSDYELVYSKIKELYSLTETYSFFHTAHILKSENEFDFDKEKFLIEAQQSMFIRGDRYAVYEIPHIKELLSIHEDEFIKLYNISVKDFINGLKNIQESLSKIRNPFFDLFDDENKQEFMLKFMQLYEKYEEFEKEELKKDKTLTMKDIMTNFKKYNEPEKIFAKKNIDKFSKFDLEKLTNWPKSLLEDLSFGINENKFFYNNPYGGWPLIELPVFERPFININNKFYCFDYYNLFDNIYRVIQKTFRKKDKSYSDMWAIRQKEVTENMVASLFKKVLPNCIIYMSNYYPRGKSLKQCNENDILVLYDDNLIIVEVKAGSYTYRSPILDIESHIKSLKTLVGVADGQAERTLEYLKSKEIVKLYNDDKTEKCEIKLSDFNEVTLMCVTLDNFNEFCSKIEKLEFLDINKNTIAISIDDFRVYTDYFESPLMFLHYLKQRKLATQNKSLYLNDELDHLGMYIENNTYSKAYENDEEKNISAFGFRENLDIYFSSLINKGFEAEKPKQDIPIEIEKIIHFLDKSDLSEKSRLATFLLDFSSEGREDFSKGIDKTLIKQKEIGRMLVMSFLGETPICLFCHQYGIKNMNDDTARDYTLATMLESNDKFRLELHLSYNDRKEIKNIKFKFYTDSDIPEERREELIELGHKYYQTRLMSYKKQNNIKKIGRNDQCPCGSGKKYKKCHGK